jgi:hypothetical protein
VIGDFGGHGGGQLEIGRRCLGCPNCLWAVLDGVWGLPLWQLPAWWLQAVLRAVRPERIGADERGKVGALGMKRDKFYSVGGMAD